VASAVGRVAALVGVVYVLVGVAGFATGGSSHGNGRVSHLLVFQVNPLHNAAHLALGALLVVGASRGAEAARQAMFAVGVVLLVLGLAGPLIAGTPANIVALNGADHLLHLASAAVLIPAAALLRSRPQRVP
jgi:Domain of unknown function (DUF4383)